jgi:hypothetical protein
MTLTTALAGIKVGWGITKRVKSWHVPTRVKSWWQKRKDRKQAKRAVEAVRGGE